ncbi:MAG: DUF4159 domain-containing protein [Deltaproteobacteria bacterium]|nr:DUF4159 domain-containing protein [Deltaproteobacteria bacterium]
MADRRAFLASAGGIAAAALLARRARAFGEDGAFEPKVLLAGGVSGPARASAPARWSAEVEKRTSSPARRQPRALKATDPALLDGPFAYWSGTGGLTALSAAEIAGLRQFVSLGGLLVVDDADPDSGQFGRDARRELARVLPDAAPVPIPQEHVVYRTFYLLKPARPWGRRLGKPTADAIIRAGQLRVIFLEHDLGGALARNALGTWEMSVEPDGDVQRERAIRWAVNLALYALTTNYKDDAVHAPFLLKRRATAP